MFKVCIFVHQITKCYVINVVLSTNKNVESLIQDWEFTTAYQTPQIQLTKHAVKLRPRDSAIVYAVVIFK